MMNTGGCAAQSVDNSSIEWLLMAENVFYCMTGAICSFPDTGFEPTQNDQNPVKSYCRLPVMPPQGQFLASNGQNACTDAQGISQAVYPQPQWGGQRNEGYAYQPLTGADLNALNAPAPATYIMDGICARALPVVVSGTLTFNLGPQIGNLMYGAGWVKGSGLIMLNSCFLKGGAGTTSGGTPYPAATSSVFSNVVGDGVQQYPNVYNVLHNVLSDGAVSMPSNPTLFSGERGFLSDTAQRFLGEYTGLPNASVADYYFANGAVPSHIPPAFWSNAVLKAVSPTADHRPTLIDLVNNTTATVSMAGVITPGPAWTGSVAVRKYPYLCDAHGAVFVLQGTPFDQARPELEGVVFSWMNLTFHGARNKQLGDSICGALHLIPTLSKGGWPGGTAATPACVPFPT